MKGLKILVGVIVFFIIAGILGMGWEWLFRQFLSGNLVETLTTAYSVGVKPLSISASISGVLGMICSYEICTYTIKL